MSERDDIPKRLREQGVGDYSVSLWDEAADAHDRLRAEVAALKARLDTAWGDVGAMQKVVDRLTAERDEADAECREANASWCREAKECIDLNRELASMREQRDEARRLYCHAQARIPDGRPEQLAQTLGWDCFKEVL